MDGGETARKQRREENMLEMKKGETDEGEEDSKQVVNNRNSGEGHVDKVDHERRDEKTVEKKEGEKTFGKMVSNRV